MATREEADLDFLKNRKKIEHKDSKYNGRVCRRIVLTLVAVVIFFGFARFNTVHAAGLTIACYKDYRPYSYVNDKGEVVGILVDFWTLWAEKNQIELTFLPGSLTQSLDRIKMVGNALAGKLSAYALDFPNAIFLLAENDSLIKFRRVQTLYTEKLRDGCRLCSLEPERIP